MLVVTFNLNKQIKGDYLIIMRNFKLATMIFAIMATICFTACDNDNDKKHYANTCEPAACEMAEHAAEMGCDDAGHCVVKACAEAFKLGDDGKCAADEPACACDPACKEDEDCVKGDDGACGCRVKDKPATCDPACNAETEDCICAENKCECRAKDIPADDPCKDKAAGDECGDNKVCTADNDGKLACADKPADPPADPCKDKAEGDACGENKTCQKEADVLTCKDAAAPTQPDPAE